MERLKKLFRNKDKKALVNIATLFCLGLLLLLLSSTFFKGGTKEPSKENTVPIVLADDSDYDDYAAALEKKLEQAFSLVDGAGKVKVVITLSQGKEIIVESDGTLDEQSLSETDGQGGEREQVSKKLDERTVMIKKPDGSEVPLVLKEKQPEVAGILIISEGGGNILVKAALIKAAQTVLGVAPHRVSVLKMKDR